MQSLELFVPASLQIGSNEPIFGIYRIILTARPCSLEARLFNCIFELLEFVQSLSPKTLHRGQRSFDAKRLQPVKHLTGNRAINPHPAKADATHFGPFAKRPALLPPYDTWSFRPQRAQRNRPGNSAPPRRTEPR